MLYISSKDKSTTNRLLVETKSKHCCQICSEMNKGRKWGLLSKIVFLGFLLVGLPAVKCEPVSENQNATARGTIQVSDSGDENRPIDVGMEPLYFMTKGFLDLIQPENRGFILDKTGVVDELKAGNYDKIADSLSDWELWVQHYLGFVVCAAIGALFIVLMPIIGLCFCCCRCCGNCGARVDKEEKKSDKCKRGTCATLLLIFILILLAGMVCGFVTNELLREQSAKDDDNSLLTRVAKEISSLENFKTNTITDFKTKVIGAMNTTATSVLNRIQEAADSAKDSLGNVTDSADMLDKAMHLADSAEQINQTLTVVKETTHTLIMDQGVLTSNLTSVKQALVQKLDGCNLSSCSKLKTDIEALAVGADFTKVDDISQELQDVQDVLGNNLTSLTLSGKQQYDEIAAKVESDIKNEMTQAEQEVDKVKNKVTSQVKRITEDLQKINLNDTVATIKSVQDTVDEYGNYRYYGGMVLCCILLLVVLFGLLGLCFGICGEPAGEDAPACNRGVGATILMFGVALCFLFGWIIMVVVLVLFLGGGLSYTEVCRYAINIQTAPRPIQDTINEMASEQFQKWKYDVNITDIMSDCEQNQGIYKSLKLEQIVNISDVLSLDNYKIEERMKELADSVSVDLSQVVIFSNDTRKQLNELKSAALDGINFTSYNHQLSKPLTVRNVTTLIAEIEKTADELRATDANKADEISSYADALQVIQSTTMAVMMKHKDQLSKAITALEAAVEGPPSISEEIDQLITTLENAQKSIQQNGTELIKQFIQKHGREILDLLKNDLNQLGDQVKNDVGRCEPVHKSLTSVVNAGCVSLLNPFNGFWFSIGMCLFCFIPFIIISMVLVGLYRKTDEFYDDKSFDDVNLFLTPQQCRKLPLASSHRYVVGQNSSYQRNYDAYTGMYPGDNIPLEDLRPQKPQRNNGGLPDPGAIYGIHNVGYITDDFPITPSIHGNTPRPRDSPPRYGNRGYGDVSTPSRGSYPAPDYNMPISTHPYSPPHYNDKSRSRLY